MKSISIFMGKFFHKDRSSMERLEKSKVKAAIEAVCQEHLLDADDILTFESLPSAIDNTIAVIEEPALTSKYDFYQISETMFEVRLKELL